MVLIGYWPLNESSGSTAYDHSGNENHGSLEGDVVTGSNGFLGKTVYNFDGDGDHVEVPSSSELNLTESMTVAAWVKIDSKPDSHPRIVQKENTNDAYILWNSDDTGHIDEYGWRVDINGTNYDVYTEGETYSGNWDFVVGTYDGTELRIYLNGKLSSSEALSGEVSTTTSPLTIGGDKDNNSSELDGKISEVRIYNHALTPAEVQYLYNVTKRGRQVSSEKQS
jgi:hypothetical protein